MTLYTHYAHDVTYNAAIDALQNLRFASRSVCVAYVCLCPRWDRIIR